MWSFSHWGEEIYLTRSHKYNFYSDSGSIIHSFKNNYFHLYIHYKIVQYNNSIFNIPFLCLVGVYKYSLSVDVIL